MREVLNNLVEKTIVFEYNLPNHAKKIERVNISNDVDSCYSISDTESLKEIIYNSIVEYSFNEHDLENRDFTKLHTISIKEQVKI